MPFLCLWPGGIDEKWGNPGVNGGQILKCPEI